MIGLKSFKFDEDGNILEHDFQLDENGNLATVEGVEEVRDRVTARMMFVRGEDPFDLRQGVPWFTEILDNAATRPLQSRIVTEEVRSESLVENVRDVVLIRNNETGDVTYSAVVDAEGESFPVSITTNG